MNTSSNVFKLPNMRFRTWKVAGKKCKTLAEAKRFCTANDVPFNPVLITKLMQENN